MHYRTVILMLLALLPAMPLSISVTAAPTPKSKPPEVYALVYVGNGSNDKENAKKIAKEVERLRVMGRSTRIKSEKFHVQSVEGTAVLRVWYADGTPENQAEIINEVVDHYLAPIPSRRKGLEDNLRNAKRMKWDKEIKWAEEELRSLPRLLERAAAAKNRP